MASFLRAQMPANVLPQLSNIQQLLEQKAVYSAKVQLKKFEQATLSSLSSSSLNLQVYHSTKAKLLGLEEAYEAALLQLEKALHLSKKFPNALPELIYTHRVARSIYEQIGNYDKALYEGKLLCQFYEKDPLNYAIPLAYNYKEMGTFYNAKTQPNKAIEYFNKALAIYKQHPQSQPIDFAHLYRAFSVAHFKAGTYNEQLLYIKKAIAFCGQDSSLVGRRLEIALLSNLGSHYTQIGQAHTGLKIYHQYVKASIKEYGEIHTQTALTYMNLAIAYARNNDLATAETYFRKSIAIKKTIYGPHNSTVALAQANLVVLLNMMERYEDALVVSQQSFIANTMTYTDSNHLADLVPVIAQHKILDPINAIGNLSNRAHAFYHLYQNSQQLHYLQLAHQTILAQIAILDQAKHELSDQDKLKLLTKDFMPFSLGIDLAHQLYLHSQDQQYLEDAFQLAERSRDAILTSALNSKKALNFGGIPDSLMKQENQFKTTISRLEKRISDRSHKDSLYHQLQEELFGQKRALETLSQQLEQNYPNYYQLKYQFNIASIQDIQAQILDPQSCLIAYYVQYPNLYIWTINSQEADFQKLPLDSNYTQDIHNFRKVLSNLKYIQEQPQKAANMYDQLSHKFYKKLIEPALHKHSYQRLIIIPDHLLGHLPFETFTSAPSSNNPQHYQHKNYLVNDYQIHYSYSGSLMLENHQQYKTLNKEAKLLAIAADYTHSHSTQKNRTEEDLSFRHKLAPLPGAVEEVQRLEQLITGTFLYKNQATETSFKEQMQQYSILHLAMHGILHPKNPSSSALVFTEDGSLEEDNFLRASEISNFSLQAQLAVLSACETGYGKFERGEGIMSLARSFMHAGVPSLVVSLWQVNDYSTAQIMQLFYKELQKGSTKSAALQKAKLHYIQHSGEIAAHPAFWAAFIQLGDTGALKFQHAYSRPFYIGIALLLGLLIFLIGSRKIYHQKEKK